MSLADLGNHRPKVGGKNQVILSLGKVILHFGSEGIVIVFIYCVSVGHVIAFMPQLLQIKDQVCLDI
jgi:hypothetical protein